MEITNNKEQVPFEHYVERFQKADATEMAERSGAKWDGKVFTLKLLGTQYAISHPEYEIATASLPCVRGGGCRPAAGGVVDCGNTTIPQSASLTAPFTQGGQGQARNDKIPLPVQTFLLRYLLEGKAVSWAGQWKTFREMPWGELYIQPYTGRVLTRAAFTFGTRVQAFAEACEKMGAVKLKNGDAGYEIDFLGGYKMRLMVWAGDEEFPPNAQVLYSDNFEAGFAPEDRVVAGDILISAIKSRM